MFVNLLNIKILKRKDIEMASNTTQTRCRRRLKAKKAGSKRKNAIAINGSTPKFAIHKDKK